MSVMTFTERERMCQRVFDENGPFWHLYTDGTIMQNVFCDEADMRRGMMALAVTAVLFDKVNIITFELMSNHVHMILSGGREDCMELFARFKNLINTGCAIKQTIFTMQMKMNKISHVRTPFPFCRVLSA